MLVRRVSLCAVLLVASFVPLAAQELPSAPRRQIITVSGEGIVRAVPDMASFSSGVVSEAKTAREALDANSQAVGAMVAAIKEAGIEARDIATSGFSVQPRYAPPRKDGTGEQNITGYEVRNTVTVRVRDLARLGDLLDKVVTTGANQIDGVSFDIAEPVKLQEEARVAAVKDARRQAEIMAEAGGVRLVRVLSMTADGASAPPMRRMMAAQMMKAESVPVEAGESEIRAGVTVTYEIEPR
ncbi:SIMPL domain-containing protein [Ancylobacter radicis]|uniref:SIMPL domain-containing protein n=1 Tax=Ancylobacter radicis TaxID=2836179 RepID=A0ABS5R2U7_9HYPH|nr:SIMPL domain-containing protein [Ancylobacter radicis]MBS9475550.1 SIMPL domain-containing protein [Ancylobacter radicis]